ncbi:MAG: penicillin-binding transpeptidase domain-containing protein, partial [Thiohalorhabdaceae bacterium]
TGRECATRFGFAASNLPDNLSLALGSASVTPTRMTAGYAALANGGRRVRPFLIDRVVTCDGTVVADRMPAPTLAEGKGGKPGPRILSREVAYQITDMLQGVVTEGTGWRVDRRLDRPVAGKTGTTNRQRDAWFLGFTPRLATGVWVGF